MGRLHHLKQTLKKNMADNKDYPRLDFVLLDYDSPDGLQAWVMDNFQEELASGYLKYFRFEGTEYFHFSHARNLAFRLSTGRIVCNVDADNFTGKGFAHYLAEELNPEKVLTGCRIIDGEMDPSLDEGSVGRFATYRELVYRAGGYDEKMESWGYEDLDLCERLRDMGNALATIDPKFLNCIPHDDGERVKFLKNKHIGRDTVDTEGTCFEHTMMSNQNRENGLIILNPDGYGLGTVKTFFPEPQEIQVKPYVFHKISYCITSMNRLGHLQETLPRNMADNDAYPHQEFLVLDYNSSDGLEDWVVSEMSQHLESGLVKLFRTTEPTFFSKSHAMNMAFKQADGDIIVNLDADNFTGKHFSDFVNDHFNRNEASYLMLDIDRFPDRRDAVGRIGMRKEDFHRVRGYDERMDGYGWEDFDICHRLNALGLHKALIDDRSFLHYILHGNAQRVQGGKTFLKLHQLFKLAYPGADSYSLCFFFKDGRFEHLGNGKAGDGKWRMDGEKLVMVKKNGEEEAFEVIPKEKLTYLSAVQKACLEQITDIEEINGAILWYHTSKNEELMKASIQEGRAAVNPEGYGEGEVVRIMTKKQLVL